MKIDTIKKIGIYALGIILFLAGCFLLRGRYEFEKTPEKEVLECIKTSYLYEFDEKSLSGKSCKEMVESLGDKYTRLLPYGNTKELDPSNFYVYIGASLCYENTMVYPVVTEVVENQNAFLAGIKVGDEIVAIDEKNTENMSAQEVYDAFCGKINTDVVVQVKSDDQVKQYTIKRQKQSEEMVEWETLDSGVGYIKIKKFSGNVAKRFSEALLSFKTSECTKLIVDLRNNPGGDNGILEYIAERFLDAKELIYYREDRRGIREYFYSKEKNKIDASIEVLINEKTASCSEILAMCLREKCGAMIIGTTSRGKGVSQSVFYLTAGELRVTSHYWYSPNGLSINKVGINPDIEVFDDLSTKEDEVLQVAIEEFK